MPDPSERRTHMPETVRRLIAAVGPTLAAAVAGSANPEAARTWARYDGPAPGQDEADRLVVAWEVFRAVAEAEGEHVARAWIIGANPWLDNDTPVNALREGRFDDVRHAAAAIVDDTWSG